MKRKQILLGIILIIAIIITLYTFAPNRDGFEIINTYKETFDNYESTSLQVIVHKKNYDVDDTFATIIDYYCTLNGTPNRLHIRLYDSVHDFENGTYKTEQYFDLN